MEDFFRDWDRSRKYIKSPYQANLARIGHLDYLFNHFDELHDIQQDELNSKYDASNPLGFETPEQLDARDTANRDRSTHTGTQLSSTISDFTSAAEAASPVQTVNGMTGDVIIEKPILNTMRTVVCGNSIAVQSQFTNPSGMSKGIHIANMLSDSCMDFRLMTATTRCDVYGVYGYSGQTLATINTDLEAQWFTPIANAGIVPDLAVGYALVENDIVAGRTIVQMQQSVDIWISMVRNRWNGVKIMLNTPHPSLSYNTPTLKANYEGIRQYMLSLDNNLDIFVSDLIGYSSVDDPTTTANPQTYPVQGSRSGTTLTVTSTSQVLNINSYFFIGSSTFYITAFGTGTGGAGTYTVSASGSESNVTFTYCPFTDNSVHPNVRGTLINARTNKETLSRISSVWKRGLVGFSSNFNLNGSTAAGSPATGTVPTSTVTTGLTNGTFSFTAEQPGVLCTATNGANVTDNGTFNFGGISITGTNTIQPFATIQLVSGAENLKSVMLRARVVDSVGNTFRVFLQTETPDVNPDYQNGDILTIVYPQTAPQSGATAGSISSLTNYIKFLTKYNGGTIQFRVISQGYYKIT